MLDAELKDRLFPYLGGIIRQWDGNVLVINGPSDHVHILTYLAPKHALSDMMRELKANSTGWIHQNFPAKRAFAWQLGYGVFSVSQSNLGKVKEYIEGQEEHHKLHTFQEEYLSMLKKHGIKYDEKYLWD